MLELQQRLIDTLDQEHFEVTLESNGVRVQYTILDIADDDVPEGKLFVPWLNPPSNEEWVGIVRRGQTKPIMLKNVTDQMNRRARGIIFMTKNKQS